MLSNSKLKYKRELTSCGFMLLTSIKTSQQTTESNHIYSHSKPSQLQVGFLTLLVCALRYDETLVVPIIENTPEEKDLKERMARAMEEYPDSCAVLVRRHGVYVWGESWEKAKTM